MCGQAADEVEEVIRGMERENVIGPGHLFRAARLFYACFGHSSAVAFVCSVALVGRSVLNIQRMAQGRLTRRNDIPF